jgi:hypothetical protein
VSELAQSRDLDEIERNLGHHAGLINQQAQHPASRRTCMLLSITPELDSAR